MKPSSWALSSVSYSGLKEEKGGECAGSLVGVESSLPTWPVSASELAARAAMSVRV